MGNDPVFVIISILLIVVGGFIGYIIRKKIAEQRSLVPNKLLRR